MTIQLGGGPEFDRIRAIISALGVRADALGGDVALLPIGGATVAVSTDVSVEGVHFRRDWLSPEEIGWRAAAAALSDLAAAGARPSGILVALTTPAREAQETFVELMRGADRAAAAVGGVVLGGDLSRGTALSVAVTVLGVVPHVVTRRGAAPGDGIWVTGELGGARAALSAWQQGRTPDPAARQRFARPEPRIEAGLWLAGHGATAMLDLSDGLGSDAPHLAAASGVALTIDLGQAPRHPAVDAAALLVGEEPALFAATGGEDYELLVTMPQDFRGRPELALTRIGEVSKGNTTTFRLGGRPVAPGRYDHFA